MAGQKGLPTTLVLGDDSLPKSTPGAEQAAPSVPQDSGLEKAGGAKVVVETEALQVAETNGPTHSQDPAKAALHTNTPMEVDKEKAEEPASLPAETLEAKEPPKEIKGKEATGKPKEEERQQIPDVPRPQVVEEAVPVAPKQQPKPRKNKKKANAGNAHEEDEEDEPEGAEAPTDGKKEQGKNKAACKAKAKAKGKAKGKAKAKAKAVGKKSTRKTPNTNEEENEAEEVEETKKRKTSACKQKDEAPAEEEEADAQTLKKQRQSRKSSAYHCAFRQARLEGHSKEKAKELAKEAQSAFLSN